MLESVPKANNRSFVFFESYLTYIKDHFNFNFSLNGGFLKKIEAKCDEKIFLTLNNVYKIQRIELPRLESGIHKIELRINDSSFDSLIFNLNIPEQIDITNTSKFNLNSLIDDYQNKMELIDEEYLIIDELSYELKQEGNYIDFKQFGEIKINDVYPLSDDIEYIIYNQNYFYNYQYQDGYHFSLDLVKENGKNYLSFHSLKDHDINLNKLYLPKEQTSDIITSRVIFHNVFGSSINLYFDQIIDIEKYLFNHKGEYEIIIEDL